MNTETLSSCQICWAQKLSQYYFQINYCQRKANTTINALSYFFQRSQTKGKILRDENTQIFYYLQILLTRASLSELSLLSYEIALSMLY